MKNNEHLPASSINIVFHGNNNIIHHSWFLLLIKSAGWMVNGATALANKRSWPVQNYKVL
ncbi:MAG: hypothetical protein ABIT96_10960 [Ferruginibacter sp.]